MSHDAQVLKRVAEDQRKWGTAPGPLDMQVVEEVAKLTSTDTFWAVGRQIDVRTARMLNSFARRMAGAAVARAEPMWIGYGLKAAQLAFFGEDGREVIRSYALLFRAAELAGANPEEVFVENSVVLGEAETPAQFVARAPADRTPECMGFQEVRDADGSIRWQDR